MRETTVQQLPPSLHECRFLVWLWAHQTSFVSLEANLPGPFEERGTLCRGAHRQRRAVERYRV